MVLNFKEIPQANLGDGLQDTFELFARDFLEDLGYEIIQHPDRGADGKKDLIVREVRNGVGGKTFIKWMVSCKHYAHSGKSVSDTDEQDILDRVGTHHCQGFIGIYSTIPATSLSGKLEGNKNKIEYQIFDRERIENKLLDHPKGIKLARRYFPLSTDKYLAENPKPAKIYNDDPKLNCEYCGKDLLKTKHGIYVFLEDLVDDISEIDNNLPNIKNVYFSCKGECDTRLEARYRNKKLRDGGWEDIDDLMIPIIFIENVISMISSINAGELSPAAINKVKEMYCKQPHYLSLA